MSGRPAPSIASSRPPARPIQRLVRPVPALQRCICLNRNNGVKRIERRQQDVLRPCQPPQALPRVVAGCGAAAVSLFIPLLPSWASEFLDDTYIDPSLADSPDILGTLLIVVVTYFTVMMLYLWLSSFLDEDVAGNSSGSQQHPDQSDLPPGYGSFLDAHVRSYVDPHGGGDRHIRALAALDEVANPLEGEDLQQFKERLAAAAAEALDQQITDVERLVRTKLLARRLGYTQGSVKLDKSTSKNSTTNTNTSSSSSKQSGVVTPAEIAGLLTTAVLTTPAGLNSGQYKAAVDALVDKELEQQLPPGGGPWRDDLVVHAVMRRVVSALVMEVSLLLLEGVDQGRRTLEEAGRTSKANSKKWALW